MICSPKVKVKVKFTLLAIFVRDTERFVNDGFVKKRLKHFTRLPVIFALFTIVIFRKKRL